jgi:hypothetical protein
MFTALKSFIEYAGGVRIGLRSKASPDKTFKEQVKMKMRVS